MSQHDLVVDNGPGINVRLDLNQAVQRSAPWHSGRSRRSRLILVSVWADQTTGLMKKRNTANTAWLVDGKLDTATGGGVPVGGAAGAILVKNCAADGDMIWESTAGYFPGERRQHQGNLAVEWQLWQSTARNSTFQQSGTGQLRDTRELGQ